MISFRTEKTVNKKHFSGGLDLLKVFLLLSMQGVKYDQCGLLGLGPNKLFVVIVKLKLGFKTILYIKTEEEGFPDHQLIGSKACYGSSGLVDYSKT